VLEVDRMNAPDGPNNLYAIARKAMTDRGLEPDFPADALRQLKSIQGPARETDSVVRDLRSLLWCSIDNDTSKDLDQLTVAEKLATGEIKILVAVADVDAIVKRGSPIDQHAKTNTTSVYTAAEIFPMLPEKLSTDLTSLGQDQERLSVVFEMVVAADGSIEQSQVYRAIVKNYAKLAYNSVAAWLDGQDSMPEKIANIKGMDEQLRIQDQIAQVMKSVRYEHGALQLETIEPEAVLQDGHVVELRLQSKNRAKELIEDFMIAANEVSAKYLEQHGAPALRRVVRSPEKWDAIREVAAKFGDDLPAKADCKALSAFLTRRRTADPLRFPDLSLTIVKLLGRGEYVAELPGQQATGHFGLAVRDYSHSTAPNRRFPDLITQRLLKAVLSNGKLPYSAAELTSLAAHCTDQEDAAAKVERQVRKSAAAQVLSGRIGETFDAIVTGASEKGTWVRLLKPPVEGKLVKGAAGAKVGDQLHVQLLGANVERGFIDFARSGK
jgi:VacB/RNase II family 3'-5' exoribonuclease